MNPPDLVQELGRRLNLTGLTLNDGVCRLVFERHLSVDIEDDGAGNLCFHAVLGPLPHANRESVLLRLLNTHLFGIDSDGAAFGVHPRTQEVYLFRTLPVATLDVEVALDVLERFAQQAETWKRQLRELSRPDASVRIETPAAGAEMIRA